MKRVFLVVSVIGLFSLVLAQQAEYRKFPPKPPEIPRAPNACRNKQKLYVSTVAGVPAGSVRGSALVSCQFHTVACGGVLTYYKSEPKPGHERVCDGWYAARDAIAAAALESCCDGETPDETTEAGKDPKEKCEPPSSWFDTSEQCRQKRSPEVSIEGRTVVLSMCGRVVFRSTHPAPNAVRLEVEDLARSVRDEVSRRIGKFVCCDKFREAERTGVPCNPVLDLDCDGVPNQQDFRFMEHGALPTIDIFQRPAGSQIAPFPAGWNPDDPDFLPNRTARESRGVGECACKWELIKGERKCSPDRRQPHVYLATWRCPTTKAEVITTKTSPASESCP